MGDDLYEAAGVYEGERFVHLAAPVVAPAEQYPMPGHADPLLRAVAEVTEDHLHAFAVPIDHEHAGQAIYLR